MAFPLPPGPPFIPGPPPNQPSLQVTPSPINFGLQQNGLISPAITVTLTNKGNAPLTIFNAVLSLPVFVGLPALPLTIQPSSSVTFTMTFQPVTSVTYNGLLTITSNDPVNQTTVGVIGTGTGAAAFFNLVFSPSQIDFSRVVVGTTSAPVGVTMTNTGNATANLANVVNDANFTISNVVPAFPTNLAPGQQVTFTVVATPQQLGLFNENIAPFIVITNAASGSVQPLQVSNNGVLLIPFLPLTGATSFVYISTKRPASAFGQLLEALANNLNCEAPAAFNRIYDYGAPVTEKNLKRVAFRYENYGVMTLMGSASSTRGTTSSDELTLGTAIPDFVQRMAYFDIDLSHELINFSVTTEGNEGPVVLDSLIHLVEGLGEYVEAT